MNNKPTGARPRNGAKLPQVKQVPQIRVAVGEAEGNGLLGGGGGAGAGVMARHGPQWPERCCGLVFLLEFKASKRSPVWPCTLVLSARLCA